MPIGKLHLLVLHFPLALIIAAAAADGLWLWRRKGIYQEAGFYCILLGAAGAIAAMITGLLLIGPMGLIGEAADLGETHESLGIATAIVAGLAATIRGMRRNRLSGLWAYAYGVLIVGSLILVSVAGHYGGMVAWGRDYLTSM